LFLAAAGEGGGAHGSGQQGLGKSDLAHGKVLFDGRWACQASAGGGARPSPASSISGRVITWPGKMRSGLSMVSRLASKIRCQELALPCTRLAIADRVSPFSMV